MISFHPWWIAYIHNKQKEKYLRRLMDDVFYKFVIALVGIENNF